MDIEALRRYCLSLPAATEGIQWGSDLLFRVGGKMFAVAALERTPLCVSFTELKRLIKDSYTMVAAKLPKKTRMELGLA
jgi:predicted DNA-binding protein (MmcQ/YjbR family)